MTLSAEESLSFKPLCYDNSYGSFRFAASVFASELVNQRRAQLENGFRQLTS